MLPDDELEYIKKKVTLGWTPDTIIRRNGNHISCYITFRIFKRSKVLGGNCYPNGYFEGWTRGTCYLGISYCSF